MYYTYSTYTYICMNMMEAKHSCVNLFWLIQGCFHTLEIQLTGGLEAEVRKFIWQQFKNVNRLLEHMFVQSMD